MSVASVVAAAAVAFSPIASPEEQYPEIKWLIGHDVKATQEAVAAGPANDVEYRRTLMTLKCLDWVLDGSESAYLAFTRDQKKDKLTREQFRVLHEQGMAIVTSQYDGMSEEEMIGAMRAALVLGDMGKSSKAREIFKEATAPDHDDFHGEAMIILERCPELSPTYKALPKPAQKLLYDTVNLAHYGHIAHLEGGPAMFSQLMKRGVTEVPLAFDYFVHTCDVAGALGHVNSESSLVYTSHTHNAMQAVKKACQMKNENEAYDAYLTKRAEWLGLNPDNRIDRVLTRVGAMLRLFTVEQGMQLKAAVASLSKQDQERIVAQLDEPQAFVRTPTYMPAVLVNLGLEKAVQLGLPFIARVLEAERVAKRNKHAPLNFNSAAGVAKTNPEALRADFIIEADGTICLQTAALSPAR